MQAVLEPPDFFLLQVGKNTLIHIEGAQGTEKKKN